MKPIPTTLSLLAGVAVAGSASALVPGATATAPQTSPSLYSPVRSVADQKIRLRPWGSGLISETEEAAFEGTTSLRITSRNYFQGGTLVYDTPVDLSAAYGDKTNLLRLVYRPLGTVTSGGGGNPGGARDRGGRQAGGAPGGLPGGPSGGSMGGPGGGQGRGGSMGGPGGSRGGQGMGGQGMGAGTMGGASMGGGLGGGTSNAPAIRNVRLVVTTTDNLRSEVYIPVATSISAQDGWRQVGIPLKAIRGFDRTNKTIKEITVASDSTNAFYLGDLRVVSDPTPIRAEPSVRSLNLALNDIATLSAVGEGGSSVLRYTWDFDDKDGITVEAEGPTVTHKFRKPGDFTVTVTVQDEYGLKDPYTTTIQVKVNG